MDTKNRKLIDNIIIPQFDGVINFPNSEIRFIKYQERVCPWI